MSLGIIAEKVVEVAEVVEETEIADKLAEIQESCSNLIEKHVRKAETISKLKSVDSWLHEVNPKFNRFDVDSPYSINCGGVTLSVYGRLQGIDGLVATADNIRTVEEMEAITGKTQVIMSPEAIKEYLLDQGSGAHVIVGVHRYIGPGHWFNAANIEGRIVAIDGQCREIQDWPPDYGDIRCWHISV